MVKNSAAGLLTSLDDLFSTQEEREIAAQPRVEDIPIDQIDDFPNHPFKVRMDDNMVEMAESIAQHGVLVPAIIRPKEDGRYEMVAGHRRKAASEIVSKKALPCIVRNLSEEEAIIIMVDSNLQREQLLPSEKAFAYKMKLDAMKRQGQRTDLTSVPVAQKLTSREELGKAVGESQDQVRRYIRLTYLLPELLTMVDEGRIAFRPAVELSYLSETEQRNLLETISYEDATPSLAQAIKMKEFSQAGKLNADVILSIMCEKKPNQAEKISFRTDRLKQYLPKNITPKETEEYVLKALEYYHRHRAKTQNRDR